MCTIGALRFSNGTYSLFKNKDFGRTHFDDRIVLDPDVFGVVGLSTWATNDPSADEFSGFCIGANSHGVLCCDANVRTLPNHADYDDLVEIAIREGSDVATAIAAVEDAVRRTPYNWANLVLIDGSEAAVIEVRGDRIKVATSPGSIVRTNHHVVLGSTSLDDNTTTTHPRLDAAQRRVDTAESIDAVFDLLRSHDGGGAAICVHGTRHQTVYSYVLSHDAGRTSLTVVQGPPCRIPRPPPVDVPLGDAWSDDAARRFAAAYPSATP